LKLLLWTAIAKPIGLGDAIGVEVLRRLFLVPVAVADC
jgi:hypothetical protein